MSSPAWGAGSGGRSPMSTPTSRRTFQSSSNDRSRSERCCVRSARHVSDSGAQPGMIRGFFPRTVSESGRTVAVTVQLGTGGSGSRVTQQEFSGSSSDGRPLTRLSPDRCRAARGFRGVPGIWGCTGSAFGDADHLELDVGRGHARWGDVEASIHDVQGVAELGRCCRDHQLRACDRAFRHHT
jgi:hypothetical protein